MASRLNDCTPGPLNQFYFEIGGRSQVRDEAGDVFYLVDADETPGLYLPDRSRGTDDSY
jgi:hypothetical protein